MANLTTNGFEKSDGAQIQHHDHEPTAAQVPFVGSGHSKEEPIRFPTRDHLQPSRSMSVVIANAKSATDKEHRMTLWEGIRLYPKAVAWSILISTCICMEGYDVCLLSNFYGFPQFNKKYGERLPDGTYQVPARWQAGLSNGANVGKEEPSLPCNMSMSADGALQVKLLAFSSTDGLLRDLDTDIRCWSAWP
jgi:hypothetical protein